MTRVTATPLLFTSMLLSRSGRLFHNSRSKTRSRFMMDGRNSQLHQCRVCFAVPACRFQRYCRPDYIGNCSGHCRGCHYVSPEEIPISLVHLYPWIRLQRRFREFFRESPNTIREYGMYQSAINLWTVDMLLPVIAVLFDWRNVEYLKTFYWREAAP